MSDETEPTEDAISIPRGEVVLHDSASDSFAVHVLNALQNARFITVGHTDDPYTYTVFEYVEPDELIEVVFYHQVWSNETTETTDEPVRFHVPRDDATGVHGDLFDAASGEANHLRNHDLAPRSVRCWRGPFRIELNDPTDN